MSPETTAAAFAFAFAYLALAWASLRLNGWYSEERHAERNET